MMRSTKFAMQYKRVFTSIFTIFFCLILSTKQTSAYYTNMPASVVLGQINFTSGTANQGGSATANTFNFPNTPLVVGSKLIVPDGNNNRVLIWNSIPTSNGVSADVVIGQPNFTSIASGITSSTFSSPVSVATDGKRLLVADQINDRVLIFNTIPTQNNASADVVIGQVDFTHNSINQGFASPTASTLSRPAEMLYDPQSGKLFISDQTNHRVLIFNQIPTANNAPADTVIGQADFTHGTANQGGSVGANTFNQPRGISISGSKLFIADGVSHRILIWNAIPTANNSSADVVVGQPNFTSSSANQGGSVSANTVQFPRSVYVFNNRLFIGDSANNRALIFNSIPQANNPAADSVVGQPNFTSNSINQGGSITENTLRFANTVYVEGNRLFVADASNHRLLIYNNDATAPGLSISSPQSAENNLVKFTGNATTINRYTIQNVQYMVNGGGFSGATATDGAFDSANENFFFTFDPKSNDNKNDGYTVQIKSTTSNDDTTDHLFYFQPFDLNFPEDRSFISKALPTFTFSVNKQQTQLKQNLQNYRVMVKKSGGDWRTYIDSIPTDYGDTTYEDKKILVIYSNNNSSISVTPKAADDQGNANSLTFDQNGKLLNNGGYEWKVQAIDKNQHVQETEIRKFVVGNSQFSNGSNWFPLQINSITGLGRVYLSTINPQLIKPKYRIQTSNPIFKGIATANSMVQLDLTNQTCQAKGEVNCIQTFTANSNGASQFTFLTSANTLKTGSIYQAQFSVSQNGLFNALPPFQITR